MSGWREDITITRALLTGAVSEGWRRDLHAIAGGGRSWRDSVRIWASGYGVAPGGWRNDLIGISVSLGGDAGISWRSAMRNIREVFESGAEPIFWDDALYWNDADIWQDWRVA